jgi:hypothetical protein
LPHVVLTHEESASRGTPKTPAEYAVRERERALFRSLWHTHGFVDPFYNANLDRESEDGSVAS